MVLNKGNNLMKVCRFNLSRAGPVEYYSRAIQGINANPGYYLTHRLVFKGAGFSQSTEFNFVLIDCQPVVCRAIESILKVYCLSGSEVTVAHLICKDVQF